ncbi:hypothetical protein GDO86_011282 [Hymenochirus boettgeri]|uniref:Uncharacterized protein n=1 Tax=Hymenochirus boettgeri TaxID=247094 RepID=A0A8T2JFU1_9PIPI|nr:hypothetical protein GDO86_011282 [Hymenochirus boettgeri]
MLAALDVSPALVVCEKSKFLDEKSRHSAHVEDHYYNCSVSVLLPECGCLPESIKNAVDNFGKYYLVKNLPVHEFVREKFINSFVKKGAFYALSHQTRIDQDNSVALLPTGKLVLSVNKDTYEELGLEGKPSLYSGKTPMRYIIKVDLTEGGISPGSKKIQRVTWAFTEKKPLKLDFLLAWDNAEAPFILSYFSDYNCKECCFKISSRVLRDFPCPILRSGELRGKDEESCSSEELFDWLGAASNIIECGNHSSSFTSSYCCPHPNTVVDQINLLTIHGFLIPEKIHYLIQQLREYFDEPKLTRWVSLIVHGFADSPVSWRECEHGYFKGGENLYSFTVFHNQDYWLQMAVGTYDGCPP